MIIVLLFELLVTLVWFVVLPALAILVDVLPEPSILVALDVFPERDTFDDVEVSEKLPESAILVELEVVEAVERLRASVILALVVEVVVVFPEFETLAVVVETLPESVTRVDVVVVLGALVVVVFVVGAETLVVVVVLGAETLVVVLFEFVVGVETVVVDVVVVLGAETLVVVLFEFEVAVALVVLVFVTGELSANFHVLKRPLESRTTSRTRPSDHVSVTTLPHVTKWPLGSRTTQYCFPSPHVS